MTIARRFILVRCCNIAVLSLLPPSQSRLKGTPSRLPLNASALWAFNDSLPSISDDRVFRRWNDVRAFKKYWARVCELAKIRTCTSRISSNPTSDNLTPPETTSQAALEVGGLTCNVIRRLCSLIGLLGLEQGEGVLIRVAVYIKTHAVTSCGPCCKPLLRFASLL